jgi:hypothetical protein
MTALVYIGAIVWGGLAGLLLIQSLTSLVNALICACGLVGSSVDKSINGIGVVVGILQAIVLAGFLIGGTWLSMRYIRYGTWDTLSTTAIVALALSMLYCLVQLPRKLSRVWMTAWVPDLADESMRKWV